MPSPLTLVIGMVHVMPSVLVGVPIVPVAVPVAVNWKSSAVTPLTASLKVTV